MKCLECNRDFKKISRSHLAKCCGLTEREYLVKHPGAGLIDEDLRKRYGSPRERNPKWKGGISKPICQVCGVKLTEKSRITHCRRCSQKIKGNPFAGKTHSDQSRLRMSEAAKRRNPATYKAGPQTPEQRRKYRQAYWAKIPKEERAERLVAFIEAGQRHNKKNAQTRIENSVADVLTALGIVFERNVQIGRYNVDFLVGEGLVIECYGDYWHCNPRLYEPSYYHKSLHTTAQEKWEKDQARSTSLIEKGHVVLCIWEHDIYNDKEAVKERLIAALEER